MGFNQIAIDFPWNPIRAIRAQSILFGTQADSNGFTQVTLLGMQSDVNGFSVDFC